MFLGLRTVIYPAADLAASKQWFTDVLGFPPYFDQPFYVGFDVGGYELGLLPSDDADGESTTYWGVPDADAAVAELVAKGAVVRVPIAEPGDGIRIGSVTDPMGNIIGIIENPIFHLPDDADVAHSSGPGR